MPDKFELGRRDFFKQAAAVVGAAVQQPLMPAAAETPQPQDKPASKIAAHEIQFPRVFTGNHLKMLAFPLGGVAAGSIALGGRGQLRDWEIFNRPNKGYAPPYAFPSIWVQSGCRSLRKSSSRKHRASW